MVDADFHLVERVTVIGRVVLLDKRVFGPVPFECGENLPPVEIPLSDGCELLVKPLDPKIFQMDAPNPALALLDVFEHADPAPL